MLFPDNQSEDKHVESKLIPRLDESSNLSSSTRKPEYSGFFCIGWFLSNDKKGVSYGKERIIKAI